MAEDTNLENEDRFERLEKKTDVLIEDVDKLQCDVEVLKSDVKVLKSDVGELKDMFGFMLNKMDEDQQETERYFHMILEQSRQDLAGIGEGVRANRERLDNHESRLDQLEAS